MSEKYSIKQYIRNQIKVYRLCEEEIAWAEVVPELGNNCWAFHAQESILEQISFVQFLQRPTSYGIPILFPFPNRIRDGKFCFRGRCYVVNPNRHGFVRDKRWNVDATGASIQEGAWIKSSFDAKQYPSEILKQFPFPFWIKVTYRLKEGVLEMDTVVQNTGEEEMPLGFGIHPYFRFEQLYCRFHRRRKSGGGNIPVSEPCSSACQRGNS